MTSSTLVTQLSDTRTARRPQARDANNRVGNRRENKQTTCTKSFLTRLTLPVTNGGGGGGGGGGKSAQVSFCE